MRFKILLTLFIFFIGIIWVFANSEKLESKSYYIKNNILLKDKYKTNKKLINQFESLDVSLSKITNQEKLTSLKNKIDSSLKNQKIKRGSKDILLYIQNRLNVIIINNWYDIIDPLSYYDKCSWKSNFNEFKYWYSCKWNLKEIYIVKWKKVSKENYDLLLEEYNSKWEICEEDKSYEENWVSVECKKWKYWIYKYNGEIIEFWDVLSIMMGSFIWESENNQNNLIAESLSDFNSYKNSVILESWFFYGSIPLNWVKCIWEWKEIFDMWSVWYELYCKNSIQSVVYLIDSKIVSFDDFLNNSYNNLKKVYK